MSISGSTVDDPALAADDANGGRATVAACWSRLRAALQPNLPRTLSRSLAGLALAAGQSSPAPLPVAAGSARSIASRRTAQIVVLPDA